MSWSEQMQTARFRGVSFHVDRHSYASGHRLSVSEAPFRDEPTIQHMGASPRRFSIQAYVIGTDYMQQRDSLLRALEMGGPATLYHPWQGTHRVSVEDYSVGENHGEGGMCTFAIRFIREGGLHGSSPATHGRTERVGAVNTAADRVEAVSTADFVERFQVSGVAGFVIAAAAGDVESFAGRAISAIRDVRAGAANVLRRFQRLADDSLNQIKNPEGLAFDLAQGIKDVSAGITSREIAVRVLLGLARNPAVQKHGASGQAQIAEENGRSTTGLLAGVAIGEAARRAVKEQWSSRQAAQETKDRLLEAIRAHSGTVSHAVWGELHGLQAALSQVLPGPQGELPDMRRIELDETQPALVVAYRLHGTTEHVQDLIDRNHVAHPSFVPAKKALEVIANG